MCPACISAAAWLIFGGTSAGGVLASVAVKLGAREAGQPSAAPDAQARAPHHAAENP